MKFTNSFTTVDFGIDPISPQIGVEDYGTMLFTTDPTFPTSGLVNAVTYPAIGTAFNQFIGQKINTIGIDFSFTIVFNESDTPTPNPNLIRMYMIKNKSGLSSYHPSGKNLPIRFSEPIDANNWSILFERIFSTDTGASSTGQYHQQSRRRHFRFKIPFKQTLTLIPSETLGIDAFVPDTNLYLIIGLQTPCTDHKIRDVYTRFYYQDA